MNHAPALIARVAAAKIERARAQAALTTRYAPAFNAVTLLSPDETRLSGVLRWLLDDCGSHGQGAAFRDRFVEEILGGDPRTWAGGRVTCEVYTADGLGRIDLLLENRDRTRCVVIENKPWAGWQAEQLSRYLADQLARRREVRVHALIGGSDAQEALKRHWDKDGQIAPPTNVTASGFDAVAAWIEGCAKDTRPDQVRAFLYDLADYCRRFILNESAMNEIDDTADLILGGGNESLSAARAIAAALPLALSRDVARHANGSVEMIGSNPSVRIEVDGVPVNFVLFGTPSPWAGVTESSRAPQLQGNVGWGPVERLWPRWPI